MPACLAAVFFSQPDGFVYTSESVISIHVFNAFFSQPDCVLYASQSLAAVFFSQPDGFRTQVSQSLVFITPIVFFSQPDGFLYSSQSVISVHCVHCVLQSARLFLFFLYASQSVISTNFVFLSQPDCFCTPVGDCQSVISKTLQSARISVLQSAIQACV